MSNIFENTEPGRLGKMLSEYAVNRDTIEWLIDNGEVTIARDKVRSWAIAGAANTSQDKEMLKVLTVYDEAKYGSA